MLMLRPVFQRHVVCSIRTGIRTRHTPAYGPGQKQPFKRPADYKPLQPITHNKRDSGKPKTTLAPYILGGLTVAIGFYVTQLVVAANKPCVDPTIKDLDRQKDVAARYDETADNFDSEVGTSEALMGINSIRRKLSQQCKGHVLEVSCGTGRNLGYYDLTYASKVDSLTFIDLSKQMVDVCKNKWMALYGPSKGIARKPDMAIRFLTGSALGEMPLAPSDKKYDTIFQTMGLCSTASPTELVQNMAKHLNMSNPDARILLLEHGRSYQEWLNNILDNSAAKHAEIHGCWFNRDIGTLVEEAAKKSGLEVVKERRHHLGTTWVFELKPKGSQSTATIESPGAEEERALDAEKEATGGYGWRGLLGWKK